ncbi:hypothetical protein ACJMK2_024320 [Sinanodonta woodiana]|uniref:Cell division cycle protein 123 homolog n=1 Tax=Sinanodonta woodiana TaxID=1069815 RepID=A0ABD3T709_SINWO
MSLSDQLKAVTLRKVTDPIKDFSSPKTAGFLKEEEIKAYEKSVLEVNTENWLDVLRDETFETVLCPFELHEAQVFLEIYQRLYLNKDSTDVMTTDWRDYVTDDEKNCLATLSKRLQIFIEKLTKNENAPLVQSKFKSLYSERLMTYSEEKRRDENIQIWCLLEAAFQALKVKTSDEVIDMFLRSERIYQDLLLAAVNQRDKYHEHFVIRKFVDIDVDMEYRGFVFAYELVALSQYNYLICSERLVREKTSVADSIKTYYDHTVKEKLKNAKFPENFIVDFAICDNGKKIWVIEINPFLETTDGALFSWQHERLLLEGAEGFQFRITERPRPGAKTMLPQSVKALFTEV